MNKKFIALVSAVTMIITMSAFNVATATDTPLEDGMSFIYNTETSTADTAYFDFYVKGHNDNNFMGLNFVITLDSSKFDTSSEAFEYYGDVEDYLSKSLSVASAGKLSVGFANTDGGISIPEDGKMFTLSIGVLAAAQGQEITLATPTMYSYKNKGDTKATNMAYYVSKVTPPSTGGSVNADPSGSTFTDAADNTAVAYVATVDSSASGKTGRWYATINGTPMKTVDTFKLPNFSAENVKLGLVYKGAETISNVALKWE